MGELRDLMDVCYELEVGPLKGVPRAERRNIVCRYIDKATSETVSFDLKIRDGMSRDEQIVVCDACYTLIFHKLRAFEALLLAVYRSPLLRVFCDPCKRYIKELYGKVDTLDGLVSSPGKVGRDAVMNLADYVEDLGKSERTIKIARVAAAVVYTNCAVFLYCILKLFMTH